MSYLHISNTHLCNEQAAKKFNVILQDFFVRMAGLDIINIINCLFGANPSHSVCGSLALRMQAGGP